MRAIKIFLIYFILIIYSVEFLLFAFTSNEQKSMINIENTRIQIAKNKNIKYDTRSPEEFFFQNKKILDNLEPAFYYSPLFDRYKTFIKAKKNNSIIPFRGPINSKSISCAEDLNYRLIENDKYGFKNSNALYDKKINSILIGDSYAEGFCVKREKDIAGNLNKKGFNTLNFGVAATGPLVSLAVLREFGNFIKPKNSIYIYFEGNDLAGLNWEKKDNNLIQYLNKDHNVNYLSNYKNINKFLRLASKESVVIGKWKLENKNYKIESSRYENFKEHLSDTLELQNIKNILRYSIFNQQKKEYDLDLFYLVVEKMNLETAKWGGKFIFVYTPTWSRYFTKNTNRESSIMLKDEIISRLISKKIDVIDLTNFFDNEKNLEQYFPLGYLGHYNAKGYRKISEIISAHLER